MSLKLYGTDFTEEQENRICEWAKEAPLGTCTCGADHWLAIALVSLPLIRLNEKGTASGRPAGDLSISGGFRLGIPATGQFVSLEGSVFGGDQTALLIQCEPCGAQRTFHWDKVHR